MSCPIYRPVARVVANHQQRRVLRALLSYGDMRRDVILVAGEYRDIQGRLFSRVVYHNESEIHSSLHECSVSVLQDWIEQIELRTEGATSFGGVE